MAAKQEGPSVQKAGACLPSWKIDRTCPAFCALAFSRFVTVTGCNAHKKTRPWIDIIHQVPSVTDHGVHAIPLLEPNKHYLKLQ